MEMWLLQGGSRVQFAVLNRWVYKGSSGDRRRAFLQEAYSCSAVLETGVVGIFPANRQCHSIGQSQRGKHDAD